MTLQILLYPFKHRTSTQTLMPSSELEEKRTTLKVTREGSDKTVVSFDPTHFPFISSSGLILTIGMVDEAVVHLQSLAMEPCLQRGHLKFY